MKKPVLLIIILMSLCAAGIIGLQLFWNYQNYKNTVKSFDHDINEALAKAVASETDQRQDQIVERFKGWLADTSLVTITADHNNRDSSTVFYTQDSHPKFPEDKNRKAQFGLTDFKEKLNHITPQAKAFMIRHFGDRILKRDLKEGVVYHYTQLLGDSLEKVFNGSKVNIGALQALFKAELASKGIHAGFTLNPAKNQGLYLTQPVNTNFRKPFKNDFVYAGFDSPDHYFFREMRWVIITSLLLIGMTIGCFTYTIKTLLSQQQLAELKEDFVHNMTHELNTPIASIRITAEALKSFPHQPEKQAEYLDIITYQADKLSGLTSHILHTRERIKTSPNDWARIDLGQVIKQALQDLQPQIENTEAFITYESKSLFVNCDYASLLNVMMNLIDNALKYHTGQARISITLNSTACHAEIQVADDGPGIPAEYREQVFEQFFRVPKGNVHNVKGFGLGLSYVKQTVVQHKGTIAVSNNQPIGSIFTIRLPLAHE